MESFNKIQHFRLNHCILVIMVNVPLQERELQLLIELIKKRIAQAEAAGVPGDNASSLFRMQLLQKLVDAESFAPSAALRVPSRRTSRI